jgi:hypothetical protein
MKKTVDEYAHEILKAINRAQLDMTQKTRAITFLQQFIFSLPSPSLPLMKVIKSDIHSTILHKQINTNKPTF